MAFKTFSLLSLLPAYIGSGALAQQHPLSSTEMSLYNQVNFTSLFAPSSYVDHKNGPVSTWDVQSWGLTTFAHTSPLRCFGGDQSTLYDVAVIGTLCYGPT